ncbi:MAG: hypothetical protein DSY43_04895 [Gammaproteobacteria bacterium]|nr:MAG: hypothetical protein DSY43_04895 [Gammaproteobacteria bacterium]
MAGDSEFRRLLDELEGSGRIAALYKEAVSEVRKLTKPTFRGGDKGIMAFLSLPKEMKKLLNWQAELEDKQVDGIDDVVMGRYGHLFYGKKGAAVNEVYTGKKEPSIDIEETKTVYQYFIGKIIAIFQEKKSKQ